MNSSDSSTWIALGVGAICFILVLVTLPRLVFGQDRDEAYADMYNTVGTVDAIPVRGRIVEEDDPVDKALARPGREFSQDELEGVEVQLALAIEGGDVPLGAVKADDEGYISALTPIPKKGLTPGRYTLKVSLDGRVIGRSQVRLLARDYDGIVVRSDVDLTYLNTDFSGKRAMARLLAQRAAERQVLPAMEVVYKALRGGEDGKADRPLVFISGSPRFFKRTIEARIELDGIAYDGLALKPMKDIASATLLSPSAIVPALEEQIGYKLAVLLETRLELPPTASELLMGDDSEADCVVYALYHRFTSGELDAKALLEHLDTLHVAPMWRQAIGALLPRVRAHLGEKAAPVVAIYINQTGRASGHHPVASWLVDGKTRVHEGAWPLIVDLYEHGQVPRKAVASVKKRLINLGADEKELDRQLKAAIKAGLIEAKTARGL